MGLAKQLAIKVVELLVKQQAETKMVPQVNLVTSLIQTANLSFIPGQELQAALRL